MSDIKYIWLEPAAFLTDIDFQMMTAEERGVYCSIIFYLYCNGGQIELSDNSDITLLSANHTKLASLSGCYKTGSEWEVLWSKIADKFQISGNILTHKRVTAELSRAKEYRKSKSEGGKKGMKARWGDNSLITKVSKGKVSNVKESKEYSQNSEEFRLAKLLLDEIIKRKPDIKRPNLQSWANDIDKIIRIDRRPPEKIAAVIHWCQLDPFWQNNVLSPKKLRQHFDRFELEMQKNGRKHTDSRRDSFADQQSEVGQTIKD